MLKKIENFFRLFSIPICLALICFNIYWLVSLELTQGNIYRSKCSNYSNASYVLPIDFRDVFGFFEFEYKFDYICVEKCPHKYENINYIKLIYRYNKTTAYQLLRDNHMCRASLNIEQFTIDELIEHKYCASYTGSSKIDEIFFHSMCFPDV